MTKFSAALVMLLFLASLCLGQGGDVFSVQSITPMGGNRYDVKLQNPKTKYVHSVTVLLADIFFAVGDLVREKKGPNGVKLTPVGGGSGPSEPTTPPAPPASQSFTLTGQAARAVWSGPWWPDKPGGANLHSATGPLELYARWTGNSQPLSWESTTHSNPTSANEGWTGHCDGFSVSSSRYDEPRRPVFASRGSGAAVEFKPGDVKGLLAATWAGFDWQNSGRAAGGPLGVSAFDFHRFVLFYIHENKLPLVVNTKSDVVWNYPCDRFQLNATPLETNRWNVTVKLSLANDDVVPSFQGKKELAYEVAYTVTGDPKASNTITAAEWTSSNRPGWVFCPALGTTGTGLQARPTGLSSRHHPWADATFQTLVESLTLVSSGRSNQWTSGEYSIKSEP
jgi:hypothetical protein